MPQEPFDLAVRIETELIERIEEAVDFACLDAMVERRKAAGLPAPVADSPADREEFQAGVLALLERLRAVLSSGLTAAQQRQVDQAARRQTEPTRRLVAVQAALARVLPDYWARFEAVRQDHRAAVVNAPTGPGPVTPPTDSGGQRRGLLRRLLGG